MKTAIIIHGKPSKEEYFGAEYPSPSNFHWLPWLQRALLQAGYNAQAPEMPAPYAPSYALWQQVFEFFPLNEDSILIGHSCGAGFLLRYLSENKIKVKRVILVAPWLDPEQGIEPSFFDFEIDPALTKRCELHMFYTDNDGADVMTSVERIFKEIPDIQSKEFKGYGHFCLGDMGTDAFPELRDLALKA